jgi:hypothetical protein
MADKDKKEKRPRERDDEEQESRSDIAAEIRDEVDKVFSAANWRQRVQEKIDQNVRLRRRIKRIEGERDDALDKMPKDGQVVVSKEDGEALDTIKKTNVKLADIPKLIESHGKLAKEQAEKSDEEKYEEAAEEMGWPNVKAVKRFLKREGLHLEFKDVREKDDDGKTVKRRVPVVRAKDNEKGELVALDEYVEEEMPEMIDVFSREPEEKGEKDGEETTTRTRRPRADETFNAGITVAETPGARTIPSSGTKTEKKMKEIEDAAVQSGMYGM